MQAQDLFSFLMLAAQKMHRSISIGPFAVEGTRDTIIADHKVNLEEGTDLSSSCPRGLLVCGFWKCLGRPDVKSRDPDLRR